MFIVLEGIDGAGKGRQRTELELLLKGTSNIKTLDFPNHESPIYKHIIHPALHEEINLNPASWFLSFALDQILITDMIKPTVNSESKHFIADGYFTTTIAYQCILNKYFTTKTALSFAREFDIPRPDLAIFIDVDPKIALSRKRNEEGHDEGMDMFERSMEKQQKIRKAFLKMVNQEIFCKWEVVDGSKGIVEVRDSIIQVLERRNLI